ncbi:DMT family transporter [Candidatus Solincola tengchongensis]|uniref:DMT family transporter n=1 Tax=Candidatus Solincola tengchongensis TaxID=2900693 RepID=UPI00257BF31A|nr:DMT family transporter [Candidatus Solincola tengchongensis]
MNKILYYLLAFVVGLIIAVHLAMNADVGQKIENARAANAVFWVIGALVAVIIWLASPGRSAITRITDVNPFLFLAGAMGAALVLAIAVIIPRIGAGATNVLQLTGQVTAGLLISHFALWSSPHSSVNPLKLLGVAVMIGGACLAVMS